MQKTLASPGTTRTQSGFLLQSGNSLNGAFLLDGNCAGVGLAQGQVSGSDMSLSENETAQTLSLTGSAMADGSLGGNYSILASGCGTSEVGTWTAQQVKTLTGSFQGVFTSTITNNLVFHFSGSLTQGPNTGASEASLSGSMTSTDAACFSSASISGQISGTQAVLNLVASDGTALGKISGTLATDASSLGTTASPGTYAFINTQVPLACGSDFGNVVLSIQPSGTT